MREYIFTDAEKRILQHYLLTREKKPGFRVIQHRIIKHYQNITNDYELIRKIYDAHIET
jgi:hypothetical protein